MKSELAEKKTIRGRIKGSKRLARHPVETRKIGAQGGCEEGLPHEKGVIKLRGETTYSTEPWNVADLRIKGKKSEKDSVERKLKK